MKIDREQVKKSFAEYTERYNTADPKIKLKIDHTYRVAAISDRIARWLDLSEEETDLAWLIGMLHDIGRFEQLRRYGTFSDAESIDHAKFGVQLLFQEGLIKDYLTDAKPLQIGSDCQGHPDEAAASGCQEHLDGSASPDCQGHPDEAAASGCQEHTNKVASSDYQEHPDGAASSKMLSIIKIAINNHNEYRIEKGLDQQTERFCHIIRDADKIDILRVNYEVPVEDIYNVTTQEVKQSTVTPEVMKAFLEHHAVLRKLKKTAVDNIIGHCALVFELVYPISTQIVQQQGYLQELLDFSSENPETQKQFETLRKDMEKYLQNIQQCL